MKIRIGKLAITINSEAKHNVKRLAAINESFNSWAKTPEAKQLSIAVERHERGKEKAKRIKYAVHNESIGDVWALLNEKPIDPETVFALLFTEVELRRRIKDESDRNSVNGTIGATVRWAGRGEVTDIIKSLAGERDYLGDYSKPSDLWPKFYSKLDELGLKPQESEIASGEKVITYEDGEMRYEAFRKHVQRNR